MTQDVFSCTAILLVDDAWKLWMQVHRCTNGHVGRRQVVHYDQGARQVLCCRISNTRVCVNFPLVVLLITERILAVQRSGDEGDAAR